ncbi:DsbA family oxidoreductase [Rodentibacter myodis]|uniref:Disulfide bond formation protein DsbA n=1 Tax=Rodentibacter myodis TaxID=1907939 RepID=A0A1V3JKG0_9PAST|nr:DsbA family oxidoreductase [Rodentibacter myodis]OOF56939.1 disulfide bond formation protein DsbA [Rodentibacter myodis]
MKIEIWSDYACPFCYIGKRQLQQALEKFEGDENVEIIYRTFELYPQAPQKVETTTQQRIEWKYRKTPEGAMEMIRNIEILAKRVGLAMNYENVQNTATFDAHRLTHFAAAKGKGEAMNERLFKAYFTDNLPLADRENLISFAVEVGLDRNEVEAMLASDEYADSAKADQLQAQKMGVQAVPFFLIDGKTELAGSQPVSIFLNALQQAAQAESEPTLIEGASCGIDGCQ